MRRWVRLLVVCVAALGPAAPAAPLPESSAQVAGAAPPAVVVPEETSRRSGRLHRVERQPTSVRTRSGRALAGPRPRGRGGVSAGQRLFLWHRALLR